MPTKQVTFKPSVEAADQFDALLEAEREKNPTITRADFFAGIVSRFANPAEPQTEIDLTTYVKKTDYEELTEKAETFKHLLISIYEALNITQDDQPVAEINRLKQRAISVPSEVQRPLGPSEILFSIPEPHLTLLRETCNRLSTTENTITIKDILMDMYFRYEVQRFNEWFYPWVVRDEEFKQLTGYTRKELKQLCR